MVLPESLRAIAESWVGFALLLGCSVAWLHHVLLAALALLHTKASIVHPHLAGLEVPEGGLPPISLLVPVEDQGRAAVEFVEQLTRLEGVPCEILVVHHGSGGATVQALREAFDLRPARRTIRNRIAHERIRGVYASSRHPSLMVVDTVEEHRADALNTALAFSRFPYFCALDVDLVLESHALARLVEPFHRSPATVAVGGVVRPTDQPTGLEISGRAELARSPWVRFQAVDSLRRLAERVGWNRLGAQILGAGGLVLFSRDAVVRVGGFRTVSIDESLELLARLRRWAARNRVIHAITIVPESIAWRSAPVDATSLAARRRREHQAVVESLWHGRRLRVGGKRLAFTHLARSLFEIASPIVETIGIVLFLGLILTGQGHASFAVLFLVLYAVGGVVTLLLGISLEAVACPRYRASHDPIVLVCYAFLAAFAFRPLDTVWRLQGMLGAAARRRPQRVPLASPNTRQDLETRQAA